MENSKIIYGLIVTGIESGSYSSFSIEGDWEKAWRGADDGKFESFQAITISDRHASAGDEPAGPPAQLTDQRLTEAWTRFQDRAPRHFADAMEENHDAITGDVFLQILAFGEIIYG